MKINEYAQMMGWLTRPARQEPRFMAEGGRIGFAKAKLVKLDTANLKRLTDSTNELYDTYGKDVVDKASKEKHGVTFDKLQGADKRSNFKRKFKKEFEKSGTFMTEEASRKFSRQKRVLREQGIQIKLLEATNKEGKFNAAKFAKDNDISMKELKKQSNLLQGNIYDKRMLVSGKDMGKSTLTWIPEDATISDNALSKLHKSGLIIYERNKIDELFYDAFGRPKIKGTNIDNPSFNNKKYLAIKDNLNEYRQLKDAINLKYPSINFQLDHPLSKSTLNNIFNASADELTRVNVLDAELNNNFKKSLSSKYENAVSSKNFRAKKAVESIAKDLNLNIGKVSTDLKDFKYGVKEFQKLNIRDEIIKSLKNQKDLSLNFKSYIKNNPDLLKIAGYDDPSKIGTQLTKVTDKHIAGTIDLLKKMGYRCRKAGGAGEDVACYMDDVEKTRADMKSSDVTVRAKALTKQRKALQLASKIPQLKNILKTGVQFGTAAITKPLQVLGLTSGLGYAIEGIVEGGFYDNARRKGYSHEQAMAETLTPGLIAGRPEDVPWYGGSEALREKELIGDPQQNPKVAQYVDALGEQDRIYSAIGKKERLKGQEIYDPTGVVAQEQLKAAADVQDLARSGAYGRVDRTLNPESMASQAYNTAVEKRDALDQRRRTEYLKKYDPRALDHEQKSFNINVRDREGNILYEKPRSLYKKRYEEMKEKFPGYSNEEIDEILAYYETSQPKVGMSYGELGKMFDTGDKQAYYADNFRMEKAQGGIMNLKKKW